MSLSVLVIACLETIYMVFLSGFFASLIGIPLGLLLFSLNNDQVFNKKNIYNALAFVINIMRSLPFIILLIAIIPFTRLLIGTSIGTSAALVPLTLAAIPFLARLVESSLLEVPKGLLEAARSMGATSWQIITEVLFKESFHAIVNSITVTLVSLVGYSAMAGVVGGGGLGDLAIRYGYQRFNIEIMIYTVVILILLVQTIQSLGDRISRQLKRG